jgi:hypothetical protein
MSKQNIFILSWDCNGIECCRDITQLVGDANRFEKDSLFERIKNPDEEPLNGPLQEVSKFLHYLQMRARFNPQRNYEIYMVHTVDNITEQDLTEMFDDNPQGSADLIRVQGTKLYSDRETTKRVIS